MIGLAFDENFNNDVLRGLLRRSPKLNVHRVQDAGLRSGNDPAVLWGTGPLQRRANLLVTPLTTFHPIAKGSSWLPTLRTL